MGSKWGFIRDAIIGVVVSDRTQLLGGVSYNRFPSRKHRSVEQDSTHRSLNSFGGESVHFIVDALGTWS